MILLDATIVTASFNGGALVMSAQDHPDNTKLRELLLYVSSRLAGDTSNGSIKTNKILFFSDFLHYATYGVSITGAEYAKQEFGPAPRGIRQIQRDLIDADEAAEALIWKGARAQKMLFPKRAIDVNLFSGSEIATVENVIGRLDGRTAEQVSDLSHVLLGWKLAEMRETIPYETVFLYDGPIPEAADLRAKQLVDELRLDLEREGVPV